jgi:hypothetical protein
VSRNAHGRFYVWSGALLPELREADAHDKAERDRFTWRWSAADPR